MKYTASISTANRNIQFFRLTPFLKTTFWPFYGTDYYDSHYNYDD